MKDYLISSAFIVLIIALVYSYFNPRIVPETVVWYDTLKVKTEIEQTLTPIIRAKLLSELKPEIKEIIKTKWKTINVDSLYMVIRDSVFNELIDTSNIVFTAVDSVQNSDSTHNIKIVSELYSRLPIDPKIVNRIRYELEVMQLTKNIHETKYIERNFVHGIGAGFGYGLIFKNFDFYIGYNFILNFNSIFGSKEK